MLASARPIMVSANIDPRIERIARYAILGFTLWMLAVGLWEIAAPFGAGHAAVLPARGIIADNMLEYGIGYPVRNYAASRPTPEAAYAHHPFGTYYLFLLSRALLGRHEWAIRLVPVLVSSAMPWLLYATAKRLYGTIAGMLAAFGWCVLPITLAFAQFPSFEMFSLGGMLLVCLATLRLQEEMTWRRMAGLLGAVFVAINTDWMATLFVTALSIIAAGAVAFAPAASTERLPARRILQVLFLVAAVVATTLLWYVSSFHRAGLLQDWLSSAGLRSRGSELPLSEVIAHRRYWIEVMFTKPGILIGLVSAAVLVVRLVALRQFRDVYPSLLLVTATIHYVYFKNGADVHIYWPLPFAAQFCLGLSVLAGSVEWVGRWLERLHTAKLSERNASWVTLGLGALVPVLVLPDGLRALDYSRDSGCRLNDDGQLNLQDFDKNLALTRFKAEIPKRKLVILRESMFPNWSQDWAIERPTAALPGLGVPLIGNSRYALFDVRYAPPTLSPWAVQSRTRVVGPYWFVDSDLRPEEFVAYGFEEREPSILEKLLLQAHDPIRTIVPDPCRTWEYRHHLSQEPNPEPPGLDSADKLRILHNVLVARGDQSGAAR
ncbi:MAG: ArnT family glycosyltransferase, partial [Myxococcales bacterium]